MCLARIVMMIISSCCSYC